MRDRQERFSADRELHYVRTENWHQDRLLARGRLDNSLRSARIALLGCGALGSAIAEILVRGGVHSLLLVDRDILCAGNLVRHTLTGSDLGTKKARALADRLRSILPEAAIRIHPNPVPVENKALQSLLEDIDVVVDCTASSDVPLALSQAWWSLPRMFVSASTGYKARRTFIFLSFGNAFDNDKFMSQMAPWLEAERVLWTEDGETLEGAGCWSPLFPARYDDVFVAAVASAKAIEERMKRTVGTSELLVFEQTYDESAFSGLRRVAEPTRKGSSTDRGLRHD